MFVFTPLCILFVNKLCALTIVYAIYKQLPNKNFFSPVFLVIG
jgi:hypothetical protein